MNVFITKLISLVAVVLIVICVDMTTSFFSSKHKNIIIITLPFAYLQKKSYLCGVIKSINFKITTL